MPASVSKPTNTLTWSDASLFDGYVRITTSYPTGYEQAFLISSQQEQMVPGDYIFPVSDGVINNTLAVWKTSDLSPFGLQYVWYAYDSTFKQLAGPSASFTVTNDTFALPSLTISTVTPPPTMPLNSYQYYTFSGGDTYTPDLANGLYHEVYINRTTTTIATPIYTGGSLVAGQRIIFIFFRDNAAVETQRDVSMASTYLWANGSLDESGMLVMPDASNVQNVAEFVLQPTGKWLNTSWLVGVPRT